jgi:hypothetical protein
MSFNEFFVYLWLIYRSCQDIRNHNFELNELFLELAVDSNWYILA